MLARRARPRVLRARNGPGGISTARPATRPRQLCFGSTVFWAYSDVVAIPRDLVRAICPRETYFISIACTACGPRRHSLSSCLGFLIRSRIARRSRNCSLPTMVGLCTREPRVGNLGLERPKKISRSCPRSTGGAGPGDRPARSRDLVSSVSSSSCRGVVREPHPNHLFLVLR